MTEKTGRINWDEVHNRLKQSQLALDRALVADQDVLDAVYRERAVQIAARREQTSAPSTALRVLVFLLGAESYALEFTDLAELLPFVNCTRVPGGPPQLLGVLNVHGEIRSVVDLGRLLELPDRDNREGGYVLLLRNAGREIGLRVDGIDKIQLLDREQLAAPDDGAAVTTLHFLKGLTPDRLRLLNTEALVAHPIYQKQKET